MITFEYTADEKYIRWKATWDGKHTNEDLIETPFDPRSYDGFHPFRHSLDFQDLGEDVRETGDVVANNPATLAICKLLSSPGELSKSSGNVDAYYYWAKLLGALAVLWD